MLTDAMHRFKQRTVLGEHIVERRLLRSDVDAVVDGEMPLRIEIDKTDFLAHLGKRSAEVDGGGRLPDAAFLIHQCDNPAGHSTSLSVLSLVKSSSKTSVSTKGRKEACPRMSTNEHELEESFCSSFLFIRAHSRTAFLMCEEVDKSAKRNLPPWQGRFLRCSAA
jgi:hypothetical protein